MAMEPIKVGVRVRPWGDLDKGGEALHLRGEAVTVQLQPPKTYSFDHCFPASDGTATASNLTQEAVFSEIGQKLVANMLNGYNGSLFAYGQTGSGKSYTVMGLGDQPGLIPRILANVFISKAQSSQPLLHVWVSYLEIYNEQVRDLLSLSHNSSCDVKILDHPRLGVCMPQLTEAVCETSDDVKNLLEFGMIRRVIAATHMNERSSRSHTIFTLRVQLQDEPHSCGRLHLTDLAGSERQALSRTEGLLLKEGCAINQGLSALALVVKELGDQSQHSGLLQARTTSTRYQVGFRTSKLTLLMKDALSGNSKTYMIATVSPGMANVEETASTLTFAASVAKLKTMPTQTKGCKDEFLDQVQDEVRRLQQQHTEGQMIPHPFSVHANDLEMLMQSSTMEYDAQVELACELSQARKLYLQGQGILESFGENHDISMEVPYLLNMSDDPMVVGCLCYHLPINQTTTIGSGEAQNITLRGIGFADQLCKITNVSNAALSIEKISVAGRVCVNGRLLRESTPLQLRHGDKVYLGRAHAFRLIVPLGMDAENGALHCGLSLHGLEDEWSAVQDSASWLCLQEYLEQVIVQMPPDQSRQLYDDMKRACKLCDEANEITAECRAEENFHFEVDLTSTVPSSIVMRVLQAEFPPNTDGGDTEQCCYATLYLWSVPQMAERLERMRDYHEARVRTGMLEVDPLLDPWYEAHPGAVARRLNELEMLVQVEREQTEQLRMKKYDTMSKTLTLRKRGDITRCVFGSWASASTSRRAAEKPVNPSESPVGGMALTAARRSPASQSARTSMEASTRSNKGSLRASVTAAPKAGTRMVPTRQSRALRDGTSRADPPPVNSARRRGYMPASAPRRSGGSSKARAPSPRDTRRTTVSATAVAHDKATTGGAAAQPGSRTSGITAEDVEVSSSNALRVPALRLPSRGGSTTEGSRGAEDVAAEAVGVLDAGRSHGSISQNGTPRLQTADPLEVNLMDEDSVQAENELLKQQLEAAWNLCNVLRSKMKEEDIKGPIVRQSQQAVGPPRDSRCRSVDHPLSRGRAGSFGPAESQGAAPLPSSLLSPRSGHGSNGALNTPGGPLFSPRAGQGSVGRQHQPLRAAPCGTGSVAVPMQQQTAASTTSGQCSTPSGPGSMLVPMATKSGQGYGTAPPVTTALVYQPSSPVHAKTHAPQVIPPTAGSSSVHQPLSSRRVERLVSSPSPVPPVSSSSVRMAWSFNNT